MDCVQGDIIQYELQLAQVQLAIFGLPDGQEKKNLITLEAELKELISLSKQNNFLEAGTYTDVENSLNKECNLFKPEFEKLEDNASNILNQNIKFTTHGKSNITMDVTKVSNLEGKKCQAPFTYKWTSNVSYHNAFISKVPDLGSFNDYADIKVKVMFTNPTHTEMMPCPYYLDGNCRFSDSKCKYSHGESVFLNSLKEYREPEFSDLTSGSWVFAKQKDGLWYRGIVLKVNEGDCLVKFESSSKEETIPLHNILNLDFVNDADDAASDSSIDLNGYATEDEKDNTVKRILTNPSGSVLGEWEKYTKGFGSKIMAKMGYVHGSGLGKDGLGRVDPVAAIILPTGKSLDHCMMLKKRAGNDKNLIKAERKLKHHQKRHEEKLKKAYMHEKHESVFTFLNRNLEYSQKNVPKVTVKKELKNETTRNLNVRHLRLAEEIKKLEKEIKSLNQSLGRHDPDSYSFNIIKGKIVSQESKLSELLASEKKIKIEQDQRRDRKKLTVF